MTDHLFKLNNVIQNYAWGSDSSIHSLFNIPNPDQQPQAELWMGAHPNGCSKNQQGTLLSQIIDQDPAAVLGAYTQKRYSSLPFLLKILAAEKPLSIQVHPSKTMAEQGFKLENSQNIPVDAPDRNYKDANHKPELVYAVTFYQAMNGFRKIDEIISLFEQADCNTLADALKCLKENPGEQHLQNFFAVIMNLNASDKAQAIEELIKNLDTKAQTHKAKEAFQLVAQFYQDYPGDIGLFSPLMLNIIELAPGEAMFLDAQTPHAYIHGTGIEIMASSDNVLRAGLTPKHIDVDELIKNTKFQPSTFDDLKIQAQCFDHKKVFHVPVDDFNFEVHSVTSEGHDEFVRSPEILLCLAGNVTISTAQQSIKLQRGESVFICAAAHSYQCHGEGQFVRAFN
ncbi:mannose-6-phosphate isomerase, class I [Psychromonas ossibalaenae]|uniref:mannose-6-phosphate isomerase, class I n=1 Tax=Psychromonas ossibalaenae TaxID=444922 RepID=UPI00035E5750|nr:mannose-6-phosphate isomerase, class I [Psychromonas ossibalaenae]